MLPYTSPMPQNFLRTKDMDPAQRALFEGSSFEQVQAVLRRGGDVLARVKVGRALPVEEVLADGSYLSHIYPDYNAITPPSWGRCPPTSASASATRRDE